MAISGGFHGGGGCDKGGVDFRVDGFHEGGEVSGSFDGRGAVGFESHVGVGAIEGIERRDVG